MAADNVLREFLVSLGFKVDEEQHKKFQYGLRVSTQEVEKLGLAITSVAAALAAGMERITDQFQALYYTSRLTGTTVANLQALGFAAGQVGVSSVEMNAALRTTWLLLQSPGGEATIRAFTQYRGQITSAQQAVDILAHHWKSMFDAGQDFFARQQMTILGFNVPAMELYSKGIDKAAAASADLAERQKELALHSKEFAKQSTDYQNELSRLWSELGLVLQKTGEDFIVPVTNGLRAITDETVRLGAEFAKLDLGTRQWIEAGAAIGIVSGGLATTVATLRILKGMAGLGGAAGGAGVGLLGGLLRGGIVGALGFGIEEWASRHFAPHGEANRQRAWQGVPWYDPLNLRRFAPELQWLLRPTAPATGGHPGAPPGLFSPTSFETSNDLRDWLRGGTSFVPAVRVLGAGQASGFGGGIIAASYDFGLGPSRPSSRASLGPLPPGGRIGDLPAGRAELAQRLYLHARAPVSAGGLGLDRAHALAMLGNALAESGLDPRNIGDNGTSVGLFQHHAGRMAAMFKALGARRYDPFAQFDYAAHEQMQRDPGFFTRQGSVGELTNDFEHGFERPARMVDRGPFADAISRALGAIGDTRLGDVHHHEGNRSVTVNQGDMHVTVHGNAGDAATALRAAHSRTLGDAVRNIAPIVQ